MWFDVIVNLRPFAAQERLVIAGMAVASCEFMFEETRNYVMQRKAFGKTIADLQVCVTVFLRDIFWFRV